MLQSAMNWKYINLIWLLILCMYEVHAHVTMDCFIPPVTKTILYTTKGRVFNVV